jgi:hypothetical protein
MHIFWIPSEQLRIAIMPRPRGGDWLPDDITFLKKAGVQVIVSALTADEIEELALMAEDRACVQGG